MKRLLAILTLVLAVAYPLASFATTSNAPVAQAIRGFCGIDTTNLNSQQKDDLLASFKDVMAARKAAIQKMVENGTITKEDGAAATDRIDQMIKYREQNGFNGNCGIGPGAGRGNCGVAGGAGGGCGAGNRNGAGTGVNYQVY